GDHRGIALTIQRELRGVMGLKRLEEIQLDHDLGGWRRRLHDFHPSLTDFLVPFPLIDGAPAAGRAAVSPLQGGVQFLPRGPRSPIVEVVDERKNLLRRRFQACGALNTELVRLDRCKTQYASDPDDEYYHDDDDNGLEHRSLRGVL